MKTFIKEIITEKTASFYNLASLLPAKHNRELLLGSWQGNDDCPYWTQRWYL